MTVSEKSQDFVFADHAGNVADVQATTHLNFRGATSIRAVKLGFSYRENRTLSLSPHPEGSEVSNAHRLVGCGWFEARFFHVACASGMALSDFQV